MHDQSGRVLVHKDMEEVTAVVYFNELRSIDQSIYELFYSIRSD